jgi:hypothetical protein
VTLYPSPSGALCLGHILGAAGVEDLKDVLIVRHTYNADGVTSPSDASPEKVLAYIRVQSVSTLKLPKDPPRLWLCFMADGGRRSRFLITYENHGEILERRTETHRSYDLRPVPFLGELANRPVVEWSKDAVNWARRGATATSFPVVEIADPEVVAFPGFDRVLLTHAGLQTMVADSRYAAWRTALGSVQGIYLIADTSTGQLYVGKADGSERILGRWTTYARDWHGGNAALRDLAGLDPTHAKHFVFSIPAGLRTERPHRRRRRGRVPLQAGSSHPASTGSTATDGPAA